MKSASETISIRFDHEQLTKLDQRRKPFGESRGEHLKRMALATLYELENTVAIETIQELRASVHSMDDEQHLLMDQLNERLRRLTFLLLSTAGGVATEEAKSTARKIFPPVENS